MKALKSPRSNLLLTISAGTLLGLLFIFIGTKIVNPVEYANSDFFSFWLAGHSSLTGNDPYSETYWVPAHSQFGAKWVSDKTFLYPLPLAIFLTPLGFLPLKSAFITWVALSLCMYLISVLLLVKNRKLLSFKSYLFPILLSLLLFRPLIVALMYGQISALLLLLLALAVFWMEQGKWVWGGAALAMLALKPSIGASLIILIALWGFFSHKWQLLAGLIGAGLFLVLVGWIRDSQWISKYLAIGQGKLASTFGYSPTIWGVAGKICDQSFPCTYQIGALLTGGIIILALVALWRQRTRLSPFAVISLSVPLVLLLTPYIWPYDQSLLIFPIIFIVAYFRERAPYLITAALFLFIDLLGLIFLYQADRIGHESWNAGLTAAVFGLVVSAMFLNIRSPSHEAKI
jgi:hypothetical protein